MTKIKLKEQKIINKKEGNKEEEGKGIITYLSPSLV